MPAQCAGFVVCGECRLWTITTKLLYIKYFTSLFLFGNPLRNQAAKRRAWLSSLSFFRFHKDNEPKNISKQFSFYFNFHVGLIHLKTKVAHHFVECTKMIRFIFCFWQKSSIFSKQPQTLANRQFPKIISRLANGKVYIYTLANCQVGDFTI